MGKARIMIVEDETIVAKNIEERLTQMGYNVCASLTSGEKAVHESGRLHPDLILMDIKLQGKLNGIEAAEQIKTQYHIPVVYLTAFADNDTLQQAITTEPFGYIIKPFDENALYSTIEMALYKHAMEKKLKQSEARYHAIVQDQVDLIRRFLPDGTITFLNEAHARFFQKKVDDLIGKNILSLIPKEEQAEMEKRMQLLTADRPWITYEQHFKDKKGFTQWYQWIDRAIFDDIGKPVEFQSVGRNTTEWKLAEEALKQSHEKLLNMTSHLQKVREEERTKVAREIHDELGQALTALKMDLSLLRKKISEGDKSITDKIESMYKLIDSTVHAVKKISTELRPGLIDDLGLSAAIEWQAEEFERRTGIRVKMDIAQNEMKLDENLSISIFRIFQEALTNIARHARATKVTVYFKYKDKGVELMVQDNGVGISEEQINHAQSFGIIGMQERTEFMGGQVEIKGSPGKGTKILLTVPVHKQNGEQV